MAFGWKNDLTQADVTPEHFWLNRRQIMAGMAAGSILGASTAQAQGLEPTSLEDIESYNNFYEFGTGKDDPARHAHRLNTEGWTIKVDGMVDKPGTYSVADLTSGLTEEERIYRFRCVEAWSMVVPWNGYELRDILDQVGVQSGAKYVAFETANRPDEMPGLRFPVLDWPYVEGCLLYTSPSPRDGATSRMPSSA